MDQTLPASDSPTFRSPSTSPRLLRSAGVAWRVETADRATLLVDGAAYFQALRRALLKAERQVLLIGWDVDGRTDLLDPNKQPDDDAPDQLRALLSWLVDRRPNLHVQVLLWDYTLLYAMDRELLPTVALGWATPTAFICTWMTRFLLKPATTKRWWSLTMPWHSAAAWT